MNNPFAKLFDTPHGQLLVMVEGMEDDNEGPTLNIRGEAFKDVVPSFKLGPFEDSDDGWRAVNSLLASIDQETADHHAASLFNVLEDFMSPAAETEQVG